MALGAFAGGSWRVAGWHNGIAFRHNRFRRFAPFSVGFFGPYGYWDNPYWDYPYDDGCYQVVRMHTPYGLRWRQVNVCG
jgi:hypothetical protein